MKAPNPSLAAELDQATAACIDMVTDWLRDTPQKEVSKLAELLASVRSDDWSREAVAARCALLGLMAALSRLAEEEERL